MRKEIITVTEQAALYINEIIVRGREENKNYIGLRISIKAGGCSGSEYKFDYVEEEQKFDEKITVGNCNIFVDPAATLKILGSELDYKQEKFSSGLVFNNPNELGACGCGKSVQL